MTKNVSGEWHCFQSNSGDVTFNLSPPGEGGAFNGNASYPGANGSVQGSVSDTEFFCQVIWNPDSIGEYHGNFGRGGRLIGFTFDEKHPFTQATWFSDRTF
jgi:hypothetical protein